MLKRRSPRARASQSFHCGSDGTFCKGQVSTRSGQVRTGQDARSGKQGQHSSWKSFLRLCSRSGQSSSLVMRCLWGDADTHTCHYAPGGFQWFSQHLDMWWTCKCSCLSVTWPSPAVTWGPASDRNVGPGCFCARSRLGTAAF